MILSFFTSQGWEPWDVGYRPLIPERLPVLVDDDLLFEDGPGAPRPVVAVNRWLRELPASGAPAPATWEAYARAVREWMEFLAWHGVGVFESRERLKQALSRYAEHRAAGPARQRFSATTWGRHMSILSMFYRWAMEEGYAQAEPFTYRTARALFAGTGRVVRVNLAVRRTPKPHVTIRYLEPDFTALFLNGLRGLAPDGTADAGYHGRELARNAAVGGLALATGFRLQEFTYLLPYEIPALPPRPTAMPIPFPVPAGVTKGRKFRTTWISYDALAAVHRYLELDRAATADGSQWRPPPRWGEPLLVTAPDARGARVNGVRRRWETLTPSERRRLVAPDGGSCLLAVRNGGGPFTAWATVFERASDRIRATAEPRFPHVTPHRLRHSFAMRTLEYLVTGHYRQAAGLVKDTDADAALVFYLSKADPLLVLRDLLGHSTVLTTEKYLRRLDTTRIYRDAYERAGTASGLMDDRAAEREADAEFRGDDGGLMPAEITHDPLGIACVFSDGTSARFDLDGLPRPALARDLLTGLAELIHPHGTVDSAGSVGHYAQAIRHTTSHLAASGFAGDAADLRRAQVARYWMAASGPKESCTRRMLQGFQAAGGLLDARLAELAAGRAYNPLRNRRQLPPYSETEWERLTTVCRTITGESFAAHKRALAAAGRGQHSPRARLGGRRTCAGCSPGPAPSASSRSGSTWAARITWSASAAGSWRPAGSCSRAWTW